MAMKLAAWSAFLCLVASMRPANDGVCDPGQASWDKYGAAVKTLTQSFTMPQVDLKFWDSCPHDGTCPEFCEAADIGVPRNFIRQLAFGVASLGKTLVGAQACPKTCTYKTEYMIDNKNMFLATSLAVLQYKIPKLKEVGASFYLRAAQVSELMKFVNGVLTTAQAKTDCKAFDAYLPLQERRAIAKGIEGLSVLGGDFMKEQSQEVVVDGSKKHKTKLTPEVQEMLSLSWMLSVLQREDACIEMQKLRSKAPVSPGQAGGEEPSLIEPLRRDAESVMEHVIGQAASNSSSGAGALVEINSTEAGRLATQGTLKMVFFLLLKLVFHPMIALILGPLCTIQCLINPDDVGFQAWDRAECIGDVWNFYLREKGQEWDRTEEDERDPNNAATTDSILGFLGIRWADINMYADDGWIFW